MQVARVIYPGGEERICYPLDGKKFTLAELQSMVGGLIEPVRLPPGHGHAKAYVNGDGKLLNLAYNQKATAIYGRQPHDCIVGAMVIVATRKQEGE